MGGDPSLATIWPDADVYTAPLGSDLPATVDDDFPEAWNLVGLLDGENGFVQSRSEEKKDLPAWGGVLVRTSRKNFKQTVKFVALEDNDTTRALVWPGSSDTELKVPRPQRILIAFETRENDTVKRLISAYQAEVEIDADIVDKEDDLTKYELLATIFPTAAGVIFKVQRTESS